MKDLFLRICIGCFCVGTVMFLCDVFGWNKDGYGCGFWGCLFWWIVVDACKEMGWLK